MFDARYYRTRTTIVVGSSIAARRLTKIRLRHFWTPSKGRTNIAESTIIRQEENLCVVGYFMLQMVATKHCCWGECKSDSRFPHLLYPALKKRLPPPQNGKIAQ